MESFAKIELQGIVGIVHTFGSGENRAVFFSVMTYGEHIDSQWFYCRKQDARLMPQKGDFVHVTGQLEMRKYTDLSDNERVRFEVIVSEYEKL